MSDSQNKEIETNAEPTDFMKTSPSYDFFDPKTDHDYVVAVDGKKFHILSGLLSPWSEYFKGLFGSVFNEGKDKESEIKEVSAENFEEFLKFVYPCESHVNEDNVCVLIEMSYRFLAPGILTVCKNFIEENFDTINVLDLLEVSVKFELKDIKAKIGATIYASPLKETGTYRCTSCNLDFLDCYHKEEFMGDEIMVNRFVSENGKRICTLSLQAQAYILQASVGNIQDSDDEDSYEDEESYEEEDEDSTHSSDYADYLEDYDSENDWWLDNMWYP